MNIIKIWCEKLLPDYGPYYYAFDGSILYSAFKKDDGWHFAYS